MKITKFELFKVLAGFFKIKQTRVWWNGRTKEGRAKNC